MMKVILPVLCLSSGALGSRVSSETETTMDLELATFAEKAKNLYSWVEMNDPVMGGQSFGDFNIVDETGHFEGQVRNVTKLNAPGFCQAMTTSRFDIDVSAYLEGGLVLMVKTTSPEYQGFKFAFNAIGAPKHHGSHEAMGSYKTDFEATEEWTRVVLPFDNFSADWSDFTGSCETKDPDGYQHECCSVNAKMCPDKKRLSHVVGFSVWAEGAEGDFALEIKSIHATLNLGAARVASGIAQEPIAQESM